MAAVAIDSQDARGGTDADGKFTLGPLPRGRVVLVANRGWLVAEATIDAVAPPKGLTLRLAAVRNVRIDTGSPVGRAPHRRVSVRAEARGATRVAYPEPLPQFDSNLTLGGTDVRGVAFLRLPPGDWTLTAVATDDSVLGAADVTVPADGDGPISVALPVK
jgi:hypothetical protein